MPLLAAWLLWAGWVAGAAAQTAAAPPQVLVLLSYHAELPWTRAVIAGLLDEASGQQLALDLQLLDQLRAGTPELNVDRARLILNRYARRRPDVIIAESLPAAQFYARHLQNAMAGVPLILLNEGRSSATRNEQTTEVLVETRLAETVELALKLHKPQKVYLVGGQEPEPQANLDALQALVNKQPGIQVERADTLGLTQMAQLLAQAPEGERAVAFYALVFADDNGESLPPAAALQAIAKSSRVPIYSFWDPMIGRGAVGGYVTVPQQVGRQILREALLAVQAARARPTAAESAASAGTAAPSQRVASTALAFDARQLERWGVSIDKVPANADVRFRQPSMWQDYRREILGTAALLMLQAGLIAALLTMMRARRKAMAALAQERSSLEVRVAERTRQLADAELRYRTVADHNANWETWNGPDGRWLYCSPSCQRITGHSAEHFMRDGGLFTRIVHADDRERVKRHMDATCLADGPFDAFDFRIQHADGRDVWMSHVCQPIFDTAGRFLGHRASNSDITQRKLAELNLMASELRLRQANEVAETSARAKSQFLSNMSHELRTPLNGILGLSMVARSKCTDPELARLLDMVVKSGGRLTEMITSLLEVTALQNDQLELEQRRFRLGDTFGPVLDQASAAAAAKRLSFSVDAEPGVLDAEVIGDDRRLAQILANLTDNAVKFTETGGIAVRLSTEEGASEALHLRCDVVDSGVGIPAAIQRGLFVAFAQADSSSSRRHQGAGLGLAISRRLAESMGGRVGLQSQPGQGSTFWFSVRLTRAT